MIPLHPLLSGNIPLDEVPGTGIVLPGGLNMYYLDLAPNTAGAMVCSCCYCSNEQSRPNRH